MTNGFFSFSALQKVICGLQTSTFTCPPGQELSITKVFYGRIPPLNLTLCNQYNSPIPPGTNCIGDPTAASYVRNLCDRKQTCAVKNDWQQLGKDPCPGIPKYLKVDYQCVSKTTTRQTTTPTTTTTQTTPSTTTITPTTTSTTPSTTPTTSTPTTRGTTIKTTTTPIKTTAQTTTATTSESLNTIASYLSFSN